MDLLSVYIVPIVCAAAIVPSATGIDKSIYLAKNSSVPMIFYNSRIRSRVIFLGVSYALANF